MMKKIIFTAVLTLGILCPGMRLLYADNELDQFCSEENRLATLASDNPGVAIRNWIYKCEPKFCGKDSISALEALQRFRWIMGCQEARNMLISYEKGHYATLGSKDYEEIIDFLKKQYLYLDDEFIFLREFPLYIVAVFKDTGEVWRIPGNYHTDCSEFPGSKKLIFTSSCRSM